MTNTNCQSVDRDFNGKNTTSRWTFLGEGGVAVKSKACLAPFLVSIAKTKNYKSKVAIQNIKLTQKQDENVKAYSHEIE